MSAAMLVALFAMGQAPLPGYSAVHGIDEPAYQKWVSGLGQGVRPTFVNVHVLQGKPKFSAVAVQDTRLWTARHNLTAADYQTEFAKQLAGGFRPAAVCGYTVGGVVKYAAVWVLDTPSHWSAKHGVAAAKYQKEYDDARARKEVPAFLAGYHTPGGHQFAAVFLAEDGEAFETHHDLTAVQYQKLFDTVGKRGYWPYSTSTYDTEAGVRFAAVFLKNPGVEYAARHGMTADEYQKEFDKQAKLGFRPWNVSGYADGAVSRYEAVWVRDALPTSGTAVPKLKAFDDEMLKILAARGWTGGALAVSRGGKTVLARGYGYRDADRRVPVLPDTPFRIASVTKPLAAAVVRGMVADGKFKLDDRAFGLLGLAPTAAGDQRLKDITVEHLLGHRGGWDRDVAPKYDPMFDPLAIAKALGRPAPAKPKDIVDFMLGKPLQHKPGDETHYSNFGYCVLGRVVEKKAGQTFVQELKKRVATPLGMGTVAVGRTRRADRNPAEPEYVSAEGATVNVFDPTGPKVAWPDGGFHLEAMDSHGALLASAPDLAKFARAYFIDGKPRTGTEGASAHTGALPGTFTLLAWRAKDVQLVVLFNNRGSDADQKAVIDALYKVSDGIANWP